MKRPIRNLNRKTITMKLNQSLFAAAVAGIVAAGAANAAQPLIPRSAKDVAAKEGCKSKEGCTGKEKKKEKEKESCAGKEGCSSKEKKGQNIL